MSTILKALRRLEEDGPDEKKSPDASAADTDELRKRILAEERASEAARSDRARVRADRVDRDASLALSAAASASVADTLGSAPAPEPADSNPSNALPDRVHLETSDVVSTSVSPKSSPPSARGLWVAGLGLGIVAAVFAGFLFSGSTTTENETASRDGASTPAIPLAGSAPPAPSAEPVQRDTSLAANETAPSIVTPVSGSVESPPAYAPPDVPARSMTATRIEAPARAETARPPETELELKREPVPIEAEPSNALARAAVTPTRAAREAVRELISEAPAVSTAPDPIVAARPRPQTIPSSRARVSAPPRSVAPSPPAPVEGVGITEARDIETLPLAELGPARVKPPIPELVPSRSALPIATSSAAPTASVQVIDGPGLPDLTVIRTSWHPTADRRSAKIRLEEKNELVTLHEGDSVSGMTVYEISPSAVVFSAGEVQIRRRVGEASSGR